jgi:L-seryl-tRNA(Ser) seleniumtransferase
VINATGVLVHSNLGRAPPSAAAVDAVVAAAGNSDLEFDLDTGIRGRRGTGALDALAALVPAAEAVAAVNNNAAALFWPPPRSRPDGR